VQSLNQTFWRVDQSATWL